jgi:hypothetical protein
LNQEMRNVPYQLPSNSSCTASKRVYPIPSSTGSAYRVSERPHDVIISTSGRGKILRTSRKWNCKEFDNLMT